jgi:hypothetical protein
MFYNFAFILHLLSDKTSLTRIPLFYLIGFNAYYNDKLVGFEKVKPVGSLTGYRFTALKATQHMLCGIIKIPGEIWG